ncbi:MAG: hypothetical protein R6V84_12865 [Desulfobacterales bacterium]
MAYGSDVVLFFEEADPSFGRHMGVSDGCDRCVNFEANYLLRQIRDCRGLVVLATNLRESNDSASTGCGDMLFEFPPPSLEERRKLWGLPPLGYAVDKA